ncbi:hypothetical protein C0993_005465 [Termitomyces sp. T159_Od127]|nr:hypothetical protein C0993_005465 [Termitomyces sp. T159_Od127]
MSPLDVGLLERTKTAEEANDGEDNAEDEWDGYWATNAISQDELDALDNTPST